MHARFLFLVPRLKGLARLLRCSSVRYCWSGSDGRSWQGLGLGTRSVFVCLAPGSAHCSPCFPRLRLGGLGVGTEHVVQFVLDSVQSFSSLQCRGLQILHLFLLIKSLACKKESQDNRMPWYMQWRLWHLLSIGDHLQSLSGKAEQMMDLRSLK